MRNPLETLRGRASLLSRCMSDPLVNVHYHALWFAAFVARTIALLLLIWRADPITCAHDGDMFTLKKYALGCAKMVGRMVPFIARGDGRVARSGCQSIRV